MKIDMSRQYTCDKEPVRLLCDDGPGEYPVCGIHIGQYCWWKSNGDPQQWHGHGSLVEVREKRRLTGWLNVYQDGRCHHHDILSNAANAAGDKRIACVDLSRFEYEVGEGLDG